MKILFFKKKVYFLFGVSKEKFRFILRFENFCKVKNKAICKGGFQTSFSKMAMQN